MKKALTRAALGTWAAVVACSGSPFGSGADAPPPGGSTSAAGSSNGATRGGEANGGGANGPGGDGPGERGGEGGSTSGNAGTAPAGESGEGGDGGAGVVPEPVFTASTLVDDMEDGNATLLQSNGDWFVIKDATGGTITPAKGDPFTMSALMPVRGTSKKAAVVSMSGFTGWGAAFGFDFSYAMEKRQPHDLGPALAVRFWAKASVATSVRFQMPNADTDELGGKCSGDGDNACGAHWTKAFKVGTEWQQTTVLLSDLKQDLPGRRAASFDKAHVYSTFFVVGPNQTITVWVDDLTLVH